MTVRESATLCGLADTALVTAMCRALDAKDVDSVLQDKFAARFVAHANVSTRTLHVVIGERHDYIITRSRLIDELLHESIASGTNVLWHLGAGFDCRPYRLQLPGDFVIVEVDDPTVLETKALLLAGERAQGVVRRVPGDITHAKRLVELLGREPRSRAQVAALTEGVTPYLDPARLAALAASLRPSCQRWITDVISQETALLLRDGFGRVGAAVDVYGLNELRPFTDAGWVVERFIPLLAAIRRLRPYSPSARLVPQWQPGLVDGVAVFV